MNQQVRKERRTMAESKKNRRDETQELTELTEEGKDKKNDELQDLIKLIKDDKDIEMIKKSVTPSRLEKLAEKCQLNLLELSLMVSSHLKQSSADGPHHKELENLGSSVEEYARDLLKYPFIQRISKKREFINDCIERITYSAIHYKSKKVRVLSSNEEILSRCLLSYNMIASFVSQFLSGQTTQNYLKKLWMSNEESEGSVKWILLNLFALFEVVFFPLIFVAYAYGIIKGLRENDQSILGRYTKRFHIPYFVFVRDTLSYVALLMLHIAVCVQPSGLRLSVLEWFIMVFFIGRFMQEIDQFITERDEIHDLKTNYSNDFWNKLDVVTIVLYMITFISRLVTWSVTSQLIANDWLVVSSYLYGINAALLSLRVFGQTMEVKKTTGTKQIALLRIISAVLVIFVQMVAAILGFSLILTKIYISEISYVGNTTTHGVCLSSDGIDCWWHLFEFLAWSTVGSSDPDLLTLTTGVSNYFSKIFYMLFLIVAAVMIMNMLIALLSNTYQLVEENAHAEWCYRKACMIKTYCNYHPVPVPFNIITLSIKLFVLLLSRINCRLKCVEVFKHWKGGRKKSQDVAKKNLIKIGMLLNAEYLAEFGNGFPLQESKEEKILKRNERFLRHIVRENYSEETKLSKKSEWDVVDKTRPVLVENQRLYILKCDECNNDNKTDKNHYCTHSVRYKDKLSKETPGFEVLIESARKRYIAIGLTSEYYGNYFPGWFGNSVGYHADTGAIHDEKNRDYGERPDDSIPAIGPFAYSGDMMGCRVLFDEPATDDGYLVEFTRNRRMVGKARAKPENLHPFVAMGHPEIKLLARFVKEVESVDKNNDESSNQREINRLLREEIEAIKEICQETKQICEHLQRQNAAM